MKTFLFIAFTFLLSVPIFSQQDTTICQFPETEASPKKNMGVFMSTLIGAFANMYSDQDIECMARMHVLFIVEIDGSITDLSCIDNCGHLIIESQQFKDCFKEKWIPATNNGKAVRSKFNIPINICFN